MVTAELGEDIIRKNLEKLREPFPDNQVSQLPKGTKAQNDCPASEKRNCAVCGGWHHPKVVHLSYVGHAAVTDRLLDVDPTWDWAPLAYTEEGLPRFDQSGGLWIKLTVSGVSRLGYGHAKSGGFGDPGSREKEVIGDAIRNAAMRFGVALELWHKGDLHANKEEGPKEEPKESEVWNARSAQAAKEVTREASQEQTPEELAVWLLAGFDNCMTAQQVEKTKDLIRKEWPRVKDVPHMKESVVSCATNAHARIKGERIPGEEG